MVSSKYRFIFSEITKTGTTSVCRALLPCVEKNWFRGKKCHMFMTAHKNELGSKIFDEYFKFSFVRNPWDKMTSQFFYRKKHYGSKFGFDPFCNEAFNIFVEKLYDDFKNRGKLKFTAMNPFQKPYIVDDNQKLIVDFLGKYESLDEDFDFVCNHIGIETPRLPHRNKSNHKTYIKHYNTKSVDLVAEIYEDDIDFLKYEYGK